MILMCAALSVDDSQVLLVFVDQLIIWCCRSEDLQMNQPDFLCPTF